MWELIRINKRNSILLLAAMGAVLLLLGYILGVLFGGNPQAGWMGMTAACCIWLVLMLISLSSGDQILLASSRAVPVTADVHPMLFNVVEEMTIAANLPKMPKIYIINDPAPNAFATGRSPQSASVAVTAGLLARLNRDELQGVVAHEISHIVHRDILFVTLAGVMLGSIVLISEIFMRSLFYGSLGSQRRYSSRSSNQGGGQLIMFVVAILFAILAPIFAQLLYFALSRRREYLADAGAVRLTRYPEGLASALEKIAGCPINMESANKVTAPMYIANPFRGRKAVHLYSTHPPIEERIRILRNMSHGAGYIDYEKSYEAITKRSPVVPMSALKEEAVAIRQGAAEPAAGPTARQQARRLGDLMRTVSAFAFLTCPGCGLKMKIPPEYKGSRVECPRCRHIAVLKQQ
ncbi:MAG TPA: M48 family metalloprotease [Anaerohalosphaeraceae bacterium]|nr:M48 family metalloprotease [Anaerohalosphaeraceae bacterium]HPC64093.1 M48 family metalloprotease [Anaerohalosphaeraceae bacterium]HRS71227.1 M48 family metalloprotease [Anaerohalosphaeraceae bacterium]HRV19386.1 M48 family metalloprotease [Anaerohalosphaeraceae bacterium]